MRQHEYADGFILYNDSGDWIMGSGTAFPPTARNATFRSLNLFALGM